MGLLDGVLGGVVGAGMAGVVGKMIEEHGGIQGIVQQLESKGLGETVRSWVGKGANQAVSGDQLHTALSADVIGPLADKLGISPGELAAKLADILPGAIDKLTPDGVIPSKS